MQPILNIALRAARQSNEYIIQLLDKQDIAHSDASANEKIISHLESAIFQFFFDNIKKSYPTHYLVMPGEEQSGVKEDSWHLHSIHNPVHLLKKMHTSAYSIVHKHQGKIQDALLVNPITGDEFTASHGGGAALNGRKIRCSVCKVMGEAQVSTNTLNQTPNNPKTNDITEFMTDMAKNTESTLVSTCNILDVAMVASGQIDAAVLTKVDYQEMDAATLLCQEAGVLSGTFDGGLFKEKKGNLVAANPKLFKVLVQKLNGYQSIF